MIAQLDGDLDPISEILREAAHRGRALRLAWRLLTGSTEAERSQETTRSAVQVRDPACEESIANE